MCLYNCIVFPLGSTTFSLTFYIISCWGVKYIGAVCQDLDRVFCFICFSHFMVGKSNPYCELSMGAQCYTSRPQNDTINPKWNFNCQFFIKDLYQDVLCITIFERDQFSPDGKCTTCSLTPVSQTKLSGPGWHFSIQKQHSITRKLHYITNAVNVNYITVIWQMLLSRATHNMRKH